MKWPDLRHWTLENLLKLKASWGAIQPQTPEDTLAHAANMAELEAVLTAAHSRRRDENPPTA